MSSLGMWKQLVRPKLPESYSFRRGNVPEYISIVERMPLHERPVSGTSSSYESGYGISVVTEDLLVSAGTREQEVADSGEESGAELDIRYRSVLLDDLDTKAVDIDDAGQEATFSSRSSCDNPELDGDSLFDAEEGRIDSDDSMSASSDEKHGVIDSVEHENEKNRTSGSFFYENDALGHVSLNLNEKKSENNDESDFDGSYLKDIVHESDINELNGKVDEKANGLEDVGDYKNTGLATDFDQEKLEKDENLIQQITDRTEESDQLENSRQVTFSESLTTSRQLSTNPSDDCTKTERLTSILKNKEQNKTYEHELGPSIMKKITPPLETEEIPSKPTMATPSANLRSQSKPEIVPSEDTEIKCNDKLSTPMPTTGQVGQDSNDEEGSYSDLHSSTGTPRRRKPKPKSSIYSKRANMKPPSQRLRKRKGSNDDETAADDVFMSAESALVMEQILEQEKRLKEGMKPWLNGRLGLSQQNSRFEIPMDVRLLETMTPLEYLTRYCIISKRRKALYRHVFQRVDKNRDGVINSTELEKGLTDVHTGILDRKHVNNIVQTVLINNESEFDLKQFSAVAAFSERISCKDHLPVEMLKNFDGQKEVIECADFFALSWKLDGIQVNPDVKKILDSL